MLRRHRCIPSFLLGLSLYLGFNGLYLWMRDQRCDSIYEEWLSLEVPEGAEIQSITPTDLLPLDKKSYIAVISSSPMRTEEYSHGIPGREVIFEWRSRPKWMRWLLPWIPKGGYTAVYQTEKQLQVLERKTSRYLLYEPSKIEVFNFDGDAIPEIVVWWEDGPEC